jgi:NAD(P)-dependent dehydrogenase (short-subunit alcohol dehydrogenase family)
VSGPVDGRVAVITGGGSGIGRATALALARAGAAVVVSDLDAQRATEVGAEIVAAGGRSIGTRCDVRLDDDFEALRTLALETFGTVDIVMNNVGVLALGSPSAIPVSAWESILDINVLSIVRSNAVFLDDMVQRGSGHIVNTASTAGLFAYGYERLPYSASKGAVVALTEALALYAKPRGVGVTCLCPGPVATNIVEQVQVFGEIGVVRGPPLPTLDPAVVGDQVVSAIQKGTFFVPTHVEIHEILVHRAEDPEGFLDEQISLLS